MRGDLYQLSAPRDAQGRERRGRLCVVLQSDDLPLSMWLVAPLSTSARPASFRPQIEVAGQVRYVLVEQTTAVDPQRLGMRLGRLSQAAQQEVDAALRTVLALS